MKKRKVLIVCGGGGSEHDISVLSAKFITEQLSTVTDLSLVCKEIGKKELVPPDLPEFDFVVPCLHGYPGETGDFASVLELMGIPFLGSKSEAHQLCFNKISTKLWLSALDIPNTDFLFLTKKEDFSLAEEALEQWNEIYVKSSGQGSSIGCSIAKNKKELRAGIEDSFRYSPYVLLEKKINGRELEVACYQYEDDLMITPPGEIIPPDSFYSFEEKYSKNSQTVIRTDAENLSSDLLQKIRELAKKAFTSLKLRHLARVDFFLTKKEDLLVNEINTFPGMTSISLFPKMLQNQGHSFSRFLEMIVKRGEQ